MDTSRSLRDMGRARGRSGRLNVVVYPNAWHRFDGHRVAEAQGSGGITHHVQPDPDAAADAQSRMDAFFARWPR